MILFIYTILNYNNITNTMGDTSKTLKLETNQSIYANTIKINYMRPTSGLLVRILQIYYYNYNNKASNKSII
jgi:hypothetical protein